MHCISMMDMSPTARMQLLSSKPAAGSLRQGCVALHGRRTEQACSLAPRTALCQQALQQQICSMVQPSRPAMLMVSSRGHRLTPCHALGGDSATPSPGRASDKERSALVNEETVYFIFQLDLDTQLQRALNYEAYEQAQEVRAKRQKVDEALEAMRQRKAENLGGASDEQGGLSVVDLAAEGLRLRTAMARAVEAENYKEAASIRDTLAALEVRSKQAESLATQLKGGTAFKPRFRLGQRVWHNKLAYRGVVVGWDAQCCETEEWQASSGAAALSKNQPFYHVLVDQRDWEYDAYQPPVAYVAQELLWAPEEGGALPEPAVAAAKKLRAEQAEESGGNGSDIDVLAVSPGTSWVELFGSEALDHPFMYILFLGQDAAGDYLPCRQLRSKYNVARRDVYKPGDSNADN